MIAVPQRLRSSNMTFSFFSAMQTQRLFERPWKITYITDCSVPVVSPTTCFGFHSGNIIQRPHYRVLHEIVTRESIVQIFMQAATYTWSKIKTACHHIYWRGITVYLLYYYRKHRPGSPGNPGCNQLRPQSTWKVPISPLNLQFLLVHIQQHTQYCQGY